MQYMSTIKVAPNIVLEASEIQLRFIRSPGPGGQNVNKVATAVQLRFDVFASTALTEAVRTRLLILAGNQITRTGQLIIKASRYRTQERNKQDAIDRLFTLLKRAAVMPKKRKKTKPTAAVKNRRLARKKQHAKTKSLRRDKPEQGD